MLRCMSIHSRQKEASPKPTYWAAKPLSFNNLGDVDAAWALVREFDGPACAVIKHGNPCGAAVADSIDDAYAHAMACDPRSAFGGIVALNRPLSPELAKAMAIPERFLEVLIAPGIDAGAAEVFSHRRRPQVGQKPTHPSMQIRRPRRPTVSTFAASTEGSWCRIETTRSMWAVRPRPQPSARAYGRRSAGSRSRFSRVQARTQQCHCVGLERSGDRRGCRSNVARRSHRNRRTSR